MLLQFKLYFVTSLSDYKEASDEESYFSLGNLNI